MKIAVCLPVLGDTKARFTVSLAGLSAYSVHVRPELLFQFHPQYGCSHIAKAREDLAERSLAAGADWLLWLDADQTFPMDTLLRLLAHDLPIVGAHYPRKNSEGLYSTALKGGKTLAPASQGLEAVDLMPFGVALISAEVFRKLPRPWFVMGDSGEDGYFCHQAITHGYQPTVDHALSRQVGHIAETVLRFD